MADELTGQGENLVVAFRAYDEVTANIVHGLLVSEGIPAIIESRMLSMYDGIMVAGEGFWGDVVVPRQFIDKSRELIAAYMNSIETQDTDVTG